MQCLVSTVFTISDSKRSKRWYCFKCTHNMPILCWLAYSLTIQEVHDVCKAKKREMSVWRRSGSKWFPWQYHSMHRFVSFSRYKIVHYWCHIFPIHIFTALISRDILHFVICLHAVTTYNVITTKKIIKSKNNNSSGTRKHIAKHRRQCAQSWWCFVLQYGEIYHDKLWVLHLWSVTP